MPREPLAPVPQKVTPQSYTLQGVVKDASTGEPLPGAYIKVRGTLSGTVSDAQGQFRLSVMGTPPFTLEVSFIGYETVSIQTTPGIKAEILLQEAGISLNEIVISASRVPEAVLHAPVTISRVAAKEIQYNAAINLPQQLATQKNVDVNYHSIAFPVLNLRGLGGPRNPRVVQRVDGVEMTSPLLGFPIGTLALPPEIDLEAVEVTSGPTSALYGPNAVNGFLEAYTRSPRNYPGLAVWSRVGVNHIASDTTPQPYFSLSARYAHTWGERFSIKVVGEAVRATDWLARDFSDKGSYAKASGIYAIPGPQNPGYDGHNTYGDEIRLSTLDVRSLAQFIFGIQDTFYFARTGYRDEDIISPAISYQRFSAYAQYFLTDRLELLWRSSVGQGNTAYLAGGRYGIRNALLHTHKIELRSPEFFLRTYGSWENSGQSYSADLTGLFLNYWAKPDTVWFASYLEGYSLYRDHRAARIYADTSTQFTDPNIPIFLEMVLGGNFRGPFRPRPEPGTPAFREAFQQVTTTYSPVLKGSGVRSISSFYHTEAQYDLSKYTRRWAELLIGGHVRLHRVYSGGTFFVDYDGPIWMWEQGAFLQASRWFFNQRVRLLASIRYDKNQFFRGVFTPRVGGLVALGKEKKHTLRVSYQTGLRMPSLEEQFIALDNSFTILSLGGSPVARKIYELDRFAFRKSEVNEYQRAARGVTDSSALAALAAQYLRNYTLEPLRPERIQNAEVGFRLQLLSGLYLDAEAALSRYTDFIAYARFVSGRRIYEPGTVRPLGVANVDPSTYEGLRNLADPQKTYEYSTLINYPTIIYAQYASVGIEYALSSKVFWRGSYSYATLLENLSQSSDYMPAFNTPKHRVGSTVYISRIGRWGGSLSYRWTDAFEMNGVFNGRVPAVQWFDAQISYKVPKWKTQFRIGGQNILNFRYIQFPGGPRIGGLYYFQVMYDPFLP